jgi:hypothetical protein
LQGDENHLRRKAHVFVGRDIEKTFPRVLPTMHYVKN